MKVRPMVLPALIGAAFMGLLALPWNVRAQGGACNENSETDCVDWEQGLAYSHGSGAPANWATTAAQKNLSAQRAARLDAARNLLELVRGISVSADTTVGQAMVQSDRVQTAIQGKIAGLRLVGEPKYFSDGSIMVKMAARLREIVPEELYLSGAPQQLGPPTQIGTARVDTKQTYSGLIIDARGTGILPAMSPKVIDPEGREVYGSAYVTREFAVQQGIAGYAKNVDAARTNDRVKGNPLVIKGLEAKGQNKADVMISAEDANALRELAQNQNFMRQTRVMIVLD